MKKSNTRNGYVRAMTDRHARTILTIKDKRLKRNKESHKEDVCDNCLELYELKDLKKFKDKYICLGCLEDDSM